MKTKLARTAAIATMAFFLIPALIVFVPTAAAQGTASSIIVTMKADTNLPNSRLLPETGEARPKVQAEVEVAAAGACAQSIVLTYKVKAKPAYSSVILNPSTQTVTVQGDQQGVPATGGTPKRFKAPDVELIITTTREAPAFQDGQYDIEVSGQAGQVTGQQTCHISNPTAQTGSLTVKNDYLPLVVVNPASLFIKAGQNKKVIFPIELQNLGNGPTRIKMEATQPNRNKLDAISTGAEVRLETRAGKGQSAFFKAPRAIEVQTPHSNGYTNSIYQFNVKFTSAFDGTASGTVAGDEQTLSLSVQVQGVYVPGFDPVMLLGILALGAVAVRRVSKSK